MVTIEKKPGIIILISMILMFFAFIYSFYFNTPNFLAGTPVTFLTMGFFMFGFLGFGYLLPIISAFYGLAMGSNKDASIFIFMVPIFIGAYAGAILGSSLEDDFKLRKYFLNEGRQIVTILVIAIIFAFALEFAYPYFIETLPKGVFGVSFNQGISTASAMDQLISLR